MLFIKDQMLSTALAAVSSAKAHSLARDHYIVFYSPTQNASESFSQLGVRIEGKSCLGWARSNW
jgi:hypothetical protein